MFGNIDKNFEKIGFVKVIENKYGARYERKNEEFNYVQYLDILHKDNGEHIVQSYDKDSFDSKCAGNTCVGLTYKEIKLVAKKMKKLGYHRTRKAV